MMEHTNLHKEIDLIQTCINRMANNSFLLKGWSVSLVTVILALNDNKGISNLAYFSLFIPLICFWYLDAFFLRTERMYRKMYDWVLKNRNNDKEYQYDLNPHRFSAEVDGITKIMMSKTLSGFYGGLNTVLLIWIIILYRNDILDFIKNLCLFSSIY